MIRSLSLNLTMFLFLVAGSSGWGEAPKAAGSATEERLKQFKDLLDENWQYTLKDQPEFASRLGDKRYNDRLTDVSEEAQLARIEKAKEFLTRFESIDPTGFSKQDNLSLELMIYNLKLFLDGARFKGWREPVNQMSGIQLDLPQFVQLLSFSTVKDYEDYLARLKQVPVKFEQTMDAMRLGMKGGVMPPNYLLEKVAEQAEAVAKLKPEDSPFSVAIRKIPDSFTKEDKERFTNAILDAVKNSVQPAYQKFSKFVKDEYAPLGRTEYGVWAEPDGDARYAYDVRARTTTTKSPQEIHEIGLKEVARIEGEMTKIAYKLKFKDLASFKDALVKNTRLLSKSREEIVNLYTKYIDQMYTKLPSLFGHLPKAKVVVLPVPEYQEKESAGAFYLVGTPDGSRPGHVMVNTYKPTERKTIGIETTAYHEGVPGHHLQLTLAQENHSLPPFRQFQNYNAYAEGWALYSERLGEEVGFFQDLYSYYGHLQDDMLRAIRLVVDTGVHYKKWSRQQMVDYFHEHSSIDEVEVQAETDRYIVWPGQALGYKIGQLKILELRKWAKDTLGGKFDIRAFHDAIIDDGAMPLDVLDKQVHGWVTLQTRP